MTEEEELEATIKTLVDRLNDAREDSAEYRMVVRQLVGALEGSQLGRLILEEYARSALRRSLDGSATTPVPSTPSG